MAAELGLVLRYEQLLGESIDKAWKATRTPDALQEAHARKLLLIQDGIGSIAEAMSDMTVLLCKACSFLAVSNTPRDLHSLYVSWLIASDLKSAISVTNLKIGGLQGAKLTKSLFSDVAAQVKAEVKAKVEPNGDYSLEEVDEQLEQWFYFVFTKSIGHTNTAKSTSQHGKENCQRIVYDATELMIDGKVQKPLYQPKPFVELSEKAKLWMKDVTSNQLANNFKKKWLDQ
ncbi:hypothetical protein [Synechococcus sp. WH 8016]|uniref:hypothetical protein n=1 Tax=Synechococcus sp. WH 8016 TaxID=166318 RepID=UPI00022D8BDD|nr:hypothetical protein [Synechococcus sp. WH 8016]EHA63815.1 hypothetical protein Syn8016DRAFT_0857 [Synechococcus sp. WH 8016]